MLYFRTNQNIKESLFEFGQFYFVWSILQSYFEPMTISEGAS
jgi:hypothetical protein